MGYGLFEINLSETNGYIKEFNESMRYMIEQNQDFIIVKEHDNILLVRALSERAADLIVWLETSDCLKAVEIVSEE